jgi:hypothetical protein
MGVHEGGVAFQGIENLLPAFGFLGLVLGKPVGKGGVVLGDEVFHGALR